MSGAARLTHDALRPGARLGRYELLVPIATGGMARVWAARQLGQRGFTKLVAVKTILPHLAKEPEFERMFLDEARIAAGVHHPNVCEVYELGEEGAVLYLAMEWVTGEALVHVLRGGQPKMLGGGRPESVPIDYRLAARIVSDAAAGLHAAHNLTDEDGNPLGVVHRDVSPHNVLLSADGNVKVCDFGVAKALGQVHSNTNAGQLRGKLSYMPLEQVKGDHVDRRSDIFALGIVLYEATTGRVPFPGENEAVVMRLLAKGEFPKPRELRGDYPAELEAIVLRALEREPMNRFPTAERMRVALEEWLARSGPVLTSSQIGALVQQRIGAALVKRREKIKQASATADISASGVAAAPLGASSSGVQAAGTAQIAAPEPKPARAKTVSSVPPSLSLATYDSVPPTQIDQPAFEPSAPPPPMTAPAPVPAFAPPAPGTVPQAPPSAASPANAPPSPLAGANASEALPTVTAEARPAPAPSGGARAAVAALAGVLVALLLGGAAIAFWALRGDGPPPRAPQSTAAPSSPAAAAPPPPPPETSGQALPKNPD
jgi:serine/threonine-protein kinase